MPRFQRNGKITAGLNGGAGNSQQPIAYASIIRIVIVGLILFFVYVVREALALLFIAIIFASAIDPWVDWFAKRRIPRSIAVLTIYALTLGIFSLVLIMLIPPMTEQIGQITSNIPSYYEKISIGFNEWQGKTGEINQTSTVDNSIVGALETLSVTLGQATKSVLVTITGIFGGFFSLIVVLMITFYISVEEDALKKFIHYIVHPQYKEYAINLVERMQQKIGLWLRGQILLCVLVGAMVYIGLAFLGVKYALVLALVAGILEIIPYLGPWLSALPALVVAFPDSWLKMVLVGILYLIVQQAENSVIVPKVMQKVVGLNPIVVIMSMTIGFKLGGAIGGLLAVPVAAAIGVYVEDYLKEKGEIEKIKE